MSCEAVFYVSKSFKKNCWEAVELSALCACVDAHVALGDDWALDNGCSQVLGCYGTRLFRSFPHIIMVASFRFFFCSLRPRRPWVEQKRRGLGGSWKAKLAWQS